MSLYNICVRVYILKWRSIYRIEAGQRKEGEAYKYSSLQNNIATYIQERV